MRRDPRGAGFGAACFAGLSAATADIVCFMDADASFDPAELPTVVGPVSGGRRPRARRSAGRARRLATGMLAWRTESSRRRSAAAAMSASRPRPDASSTSSGSAGARTRRPPIRLAAGDGAAGPRGVANRGAPSPTAPGSAAPRSPARSAAPYGRSGHVQAAGGRPPSRPARPGARVFSHPGPSHRSTPGSVRPELPSGKRTVKQHPPRRFDTSMCPVAPRPIPSRWQARAPPHPRHDRGRRRRGTPRRTPGPGPPPGCRRTRRPPTRSPLSLGLDRHDDLAARGRVANGVVQQVPQHSGRLGAATPDHASPAPSSPRPRGPRVGRSRRAPRDELRTPTGCGVSSIEPAVMRLSSNRSSTRTVRRSVSEQIDRRYRPTSSGPSTTPSSIASAIARIPAKGLRRSCDTQATSSRRTAPAPAPARAPAQLA